MELSDSRTYSDVGQPMPIPISEYVAYCELFGIKLLSERETFFRQVRALDRAYREVVSEQLSQKLETDKKTDSGVAS